MDNGDSTTPAISSRIYLHDFPGPPREHLKIRPACLSREIIRFLLIPGTSLRTLPFYDT